MTARSFLRFEKRPRAAGRVTDVYEVCTSGKPYDEDAPQFSELGEIRWYSAWRRYVFFPRDGTLYDAGCLREVAEFLGTLMAERIKGAS